MYIYYIIIFLVDYRICSQYFCQFIFTSSVNMFVNVCVCGGFVCIAKG